MRLARSNDDPRLLADLERLAGGGPPPQPEPDPEPSAAPSTGPPAVAAGSAAAVAAIDDSFVRRFVQGSVHLRRYAPFYAGGGLWLLTLVLIQPVGGGDDGRRFAPAELAGAGAVTASASEPPSEPDETAGPIFDSLGGSAFSGATFDMATDTGTSFGGEDFALSEPSEFTESSDDAGSDSSDLESFESFEDFDEAEEPVPVSIVSTGYASSTGGTPLEQEPADGGLPVTVAGGSTTRYSFLRLTGDEDTLRLRETGESLNHETSAVRLCPLASGDWEAGPGQAMADAPAVDESALCASGTRDGEGIWTFDLADFAPVGETNGFALVPGSGTGSTFQVVFAPVAVPPAESTEA